MYHRQFNYKDDSKRKTKDQGEKDKTFVCHFKTGNTECGSIFNSYYKLRQHKNPVGHKRKVFNTTEETDANEKRRENVNSIRTGLFESV